MLASYTIFIPFLLLLILYFALTLLYTLTPPQTITLQPWPLLPHPSSLSLTVHCQVDADCESDHVCLSHTCTPKLLRGSHCTPEKGYWTHYFIEDSTFAICSCLDNQLFDRNVLGGDCTVSVACGVHGRYDPVSQACHCDSGYQAKGKTCETLPILERRAEFPCGPDELEVSTLDPVRNAFFHADYLSSKLSAARCVQRPCSFDALSGRPLKHTQHVPEFGCVCDPSYGLFGVQLNLSNTAPYTKTPGFDACASLFLRDPQQPIEVKVVTYFYLMHRDPVSLIVFENLKDDSLFPLFRGRKGQFMIEQASWRYDFAQHYFKTNPTFRTRVRKLGDGDLFGNERKEDYYQDTFKPPFCHMLANQLPTPVEKKIAYRILYENPVCLISQQDPIAQDEFKDRVVVNPHHLTLIENDGMDRFNAFVLEYDQQLNRWTMDIAFPYKMDVYPHSNTNAPRY